MTLPVSDMVIMVLNFENECEFFWVLLGRFILQRVVETLFGLCQKHERSFRSTFCLLPTLIIPILVWKQELSSFKNQFPYLFEWWTREPPSLGVGTKKPYGMKGVWTEKPGFLNWILLGLKNLSMFSILGFLGFGGWIWVSVSPPKTHHIYDIVLFSFNFF